MQRRELCRHPCRHLCSATLSIDTIWGTSILRPTNSQLRVWAPPLFSRGEACAGPALCGLSCELIASDFTELLGDDDSFGWQTERYPRPSGQDEALRHLRKQFVLLGPSHRPPAPSAIQRGWKGERGCSARKASLSMPRFGASAACARHVVSPVTERTNMASALGRSFPLTRLAALRCRLLPAPFL